MKAMFKFLSLAAILAVAAAPAAHADTLGGPGVYYGTGNAGTNHGFTVVTVGSLQLGLQAIIPTVAPITPSGNNYLYTPGAAGPPNPANYATWDFVFSVNTGSAPLSTYSYNIKITDNTTSASINGNVTSATIGDSALANSSGPVCNGTTQSCTGLYNPATEDGFQNAENLGFPFLAGPLSFHASAADDYTITLTATGAGLPGGSLTDAINVVPTPEPSSLIFLGTGLLGGLGTMIRRRRIA